MCCRISRVLYKNITLNLRFCFDKLLSYFMQINLGFSQTHFLLQPICLTTLFFLYRFLVLLPKTFGQKLFTAPFRFCFLLILHYPKEIKSYHTDWEMWNKNNETYVRFVEGWRPSSLWRDYWRLVRLLWQKQAILLEISEVWDSRFLGSRCGCFVPEASAPLRLDTPCTMAASLRLCMYTTGTKNKWVISSVSILTVVRKNTHKSSHCCFCLTSVCLIAYRYKSFFSVFTYIFLIKKILFNYFDFIRNKFKRHSLESFIVGFKIQKTPRQFLMH